MSLQHFVFLFVTAKDEIAELIFTLFYGKMLDIETRFVFNFFCRPSWIKEIVVYGFFSVKPNVG